MCKDLCVLPFSWFNAKVVHLAFAICDLCSEFDKEMLNYILLESL